MEKKKSHAFNKRLLQQFRVKKLAILRRWKIIFKINL